MLSGQLIINYTSVAMPQIPCKYIYLVPVILYSALEANAWNNK